MEFINTLRDIYGKNDFRLEMFPTGKKGPFAVICPGGGYSMVCSFVEGRPFAKALNEMGYSAFVVRYRVREKALYPAPQEDLARAVRYILDHAAELNVDTEGYAVFGSSAGGHLAASFGTESMGYPVYNLPKPACLCLVYPVVCMDGRGHGDSTRRLLGENPTDAEMQAKSIQNCITPNYPPVFLWNSDADTVVPPENSKLLDKVLTDHGIRHEYVCYDNVKHGAGLAKGTSAEGWLRRAVFFWENCR